MDWLKRFFGRPVDVPSPSDIVPTGNISYIVGKLVVDIWDASTGTSLINIPFTKPPMVTPAELEPSKSMDGLMDVGNNPLLMRGADDENQKILCAFLKVGDVIVYNNGKMFAIHRIAKIEWDKDGRKFWTKGINNFWQDPWPVRDEHVLWLCFGVID